MFVLSGSIIEKSAGENNELVAESLKNAAEEASAAMTMRRMWDLTYRINAGALKYAAGSVRTASEPIVSEGDLGHSVGTSDLPHWSPLIRSTFCPRGLNI